MFKWFEATSEQMKNMLFTHLYGFLFVWCAACEPIIYDSEWVLVLNAEL